MGRYLFSFLDGTPFELVIYLFALMFLGFIAYIVVKVLIEHLKEKKCNHGNRGICYFCDLEMNQPLQNEKNAENSELIHPKEIIEGLILFGLPIATTDIQLIRMRYEEINNKYHANREFTRIMKSNYSLLNAYFTDIYNACNIANPSTNEAS